LALAPATILERLIELTELESELIVVADATAMQQVVVERAELLAQLPAELPESCRPLVGRFCDLAAANEQSATAAAGVLRRELGQLSSGRSAVTAYAQAAPPVSMDRKG
jgi:hypothetical protein